MYIGSFERYVLRSNQSAQTAPVGIVFGAGISKDGKPYKELQARLDSAADALERGVVQKLLLSGDNRFDHYNEPDAMITYLVQERGVSPSLLTPDYAGRSTFETCDRANSVFKVQQAMLFSASSHLPRAIFTCRSFSVKSYGIGNDSEANNAWRREPLARFKALFNVYILGEKTIKGDTISI